MTFRDRDAVVEDGSPEPPPRKRHAMPLWQETVLLVVVALALAVLIKAAFLQAFYIPSESMEPGLVENDRILVQKVAYWGDGTPQRGDVVVFKDPGGWLGPGDVIGSENLLTSVMARIGLYPSGGHLVKRVVGVAGDVISCCDKRGRLRVNGRSITESEYIDRSPGMNCNGPMTGNCDWKAGPIPPGHVFVMGDNRDRSADSTVHLCRTTETECVPGEEFVPEDLVVGKVFALVWPTDHIRWVRRPAAFAKVPDRA